MLRTGGNLQDLFTRVTCALLGAVLGGLAYASMRGEVYVMAVITALFVCLSLFSAVQATPTILPLRT